METASRFVMLALLAYERELISLSRLAELLTVDRSTVARVVGFHGLAVRHGPANRDEALADVATLRLLRRTDARPERDDQAIQAFGVSEPQTPAGTGARSASAKAAITPSRSRLRSRVSGDSRPIAVSATRR